MSDLLFDRQRAVLDELWSFLEEHCTAEKELTSSSANARRAASHEVETTRQTLTQNQERELADLDTAFHDDQHGITESHATEEEAARESLAVSRQQMDTTERDERKRLVAAMNDALWLADSVADGGQKRVDEQLEAVRRKVAANGTKIDALWDKMEPFLARVELGREDVEVDEKSIQLGLDSPIDHEIVLGHAQALLRTIQRWRVLKWLRWPTTVGILIVAEVLCCLPALWFRPWLFWLIGGVIGGVLVALGSRALLHTLAHRRVYSLGEEFGALLAQARYLGRELVRQSEERASAERTGLGRKQAADRHAAQTTYKPLLQDLAQRSRAERETLEQQFQVAAQGRRLATRQALEAARQRHEEARELCLSRQEQERSDFEVAQVSRLREVEEMCIQNEHQLRERWETGAARLMDRLTELQQFASNEEVANAPSTISRLPFGHLTVDIQQWFGDLTNEQLPPFPAHPLDVPAFLPFPRRGGLLLQSAGEGKAVAVQTLQALMLRFLTALPPGKVRFTIFDPVGLGDNFAAFMHLADHDEVLVTSRIWTEPAHLEKQLADLTDHMENVIQKYLRSQFSSIEDYNVQAGEVAEAYRVLIVANFPINFTPQAANRLVSIVQSGSRCGVYALIGMDVRQPLPQGFQAEDLKQLCFNLYWRKDRFQWGDPAMDRYPLVLDTPPEASEIIETAGRVGALSRDASRVRVPFSFIAPPEDQVWKGDSRRGVTVPLGRAGAVRRLSLQLGQGTSQHVLVAGKTGSGKSTLWHAIITNLALLYGPDEVELYLIDFKKGVEFKAYAIHELPHARVIAVESEREFGLSVLQKLDAELRRRGDLFRASGVNDVASYRDAHPEERCPRNLLIVDEFQEFFVEDDRLSQEAALLLDRLVRQGRAFGLHVLLGSQTLGGAYSLARSTIDQMAVRIALQCSEADAQLILNKDNSAARLLSRPGEAIYNDTNGSLEGNEVFQVVWLPDEEREQTLEAVRQRAAQERPDAVRRRPLVFEGNTPAELDHNPLLRSRLEAPSAIHDPQSAIAKAWLGEAIAIKDPTAALFRPQTGDNLLIVGQNDEAALAMLTSGLVSLAVQDRSAEFVLFDGTAPHEPHSDYFRSAAEGWPQRVELAERTGIAAALTGLVDEMNQRLKGTKTDVAARYVFINGLHRYREFRRSDDDMGFGRRGAERTVSPLENLQSLLRDGPMARIHLLIWCDTLANVMRSLDRQGLRECGQRVVFQMSAADSSHLLDSPLASRLGRNRALYSIDEAAQAEKFRPYGLPSLTWLAEVKQRLAG